MGLPKDAVKFIITNAVLLTISTLIVGLRFITRVRSKALLKLDDWTILVALVCSGGICGSAIWAANHGIRGVPLETLTYASWVTHRKLLFSDVLICHFLFGLIKISVILFYRRIFTHYPKFNIFSIILLVSNAIFIISSFFAVLFSSRGVSAFWTTPPSGESGNVDTTVVDFPALLIAIAVIDVVLDLAILTLPIPIIIHLRLPPLKKITVIAIFFSGGFCLVSSVIRLYYTHTLLAFTGTNTVRLLDLVDNNDLWAHIEVFASIITACLPTLGPLLRGHHTLESLIGSVRSLFSIRSRASSKADGAGGYLPRKPSGASLDRDRRAWFELSTKGSEPATVTQGYTHGIESEGELSNAIVVQQTLSIRNEQHV